MKPKGHYLDDVERAVLDPKVGSRTAPDRIYQARGKPVLAVNMTRHIAPGDRITLNGQTWLVTGFLGLWNRQNTWAVTPT